MIGKFGKKAHFQINADYLKALGFNSLIHLQSKAFGYNKKEVVYMKLILAMYLITSSFSFAKDCGEDSTIDMIYRSNCKDAFCYRVNKKCIAGDDQVYACDFFAICVDKSGKKTNTANVNYTQDCTISAFKGVINCRKNAADRGQCMESDNECAYGKAEVTYACKKFVICKYDDSQEAFKNKSKVMIIN